MGHKGIVGSPSFSPDGKRLFTGSNGIEKVWDLTNFVEVMTFDTGSGGIIPCCMALSPDGKRIAALNSAGAIVVRDVETRDEVIRR